MGIQLSDWWKTLWEKEKLLVAYLWSKGLKLIAYKLFEDSDADLSWLLF